MKRLVSILGLAASVVAACCMTGCGPSSNSGSKDGKPDNPEAMADGMIALAVSVRESGGSAFAVALDGGHVYSGQDHEFTVNAGDTLTFDMIAEAYHDWFMEDAGFVFCENLYTDKACLTKFVGAVTSDVTLYLGMYSPAKYGEVVFDYDGEEYVVYRAVGASVSATDFSRSAYGMGEASDYVFYSDDARTVVLDLSNVEVASGFSSKTIIYVGDAE